MRISDWSSDVCSSDLLGGRMDHGNSYRSPCEPVMYPPGPAVSNASSFIRRDFAPRLLAAPRLQPLQHQVFPAASAVQPQPVAPSLYYRFPSDRPALPALIWKSILSSHLRLRANRDRKSVVEGKRVSVRVDLVGRRTLKKKNNKN